MASPETTQTSPEAPDENIGLLANGSSGPWEVSVDETISGDERWFAQIEGPSVYVSFEIPSPNIIGEAVRFLAHLMTRSGNPSPPREVMVGCA